MFVAWCSFDVSCDIGGGRRCRGRGNRGRGRGLRRGTLLFILKGEEVLKLFVNPDVHVVNDVNLLHLDRIHFHVCARGQEQATGQHEGEHF